MQIQSKEQYETLKAEAVFKREQGNMQEALDIFSNLEDWDETHGNFKDQVDVLGHLRITYSMMSAGVEDKLSLLNAALVCVDKAMQIISSQHLEEGVLAITKVHKAAVLRGLSGIELNVTRKAELLAEALALVDEALVSFPGSKAHLAWPLNQKANILLLQGNGDAAYDVVLAGQKALFEGYVDEEAAGDQAEIKLPIWLSGLYLTAAEICAKENKLILANFYVQSVLSMPDERGILKDRKREAQSLLAKLK